jgi:hypothetical protein
MSAKGSLHWRPLFAVGALMGLLAILGTALPYAPRPGADEAQFCQGPVYRIVLPEAEPAIPEGPHRALFQANCRLCHSPRLVLTQPHLSEKDWDIVVKKMITVYGALIPPEQEPEIVAYLTAVRGEARGVSERPPRSASAPR